MKRIILIIIVFPFLGLTSGCANNTSNNSTNLTTTSKENTTATQLNDDYLVYLVQKEKRYFYGEEIDPSDYEINIVNKKNKRNRDNFSNI